jgi:quinol monooxygenase YgiN
MFVVAAQYYAKEGKADEILAILRQMIPISRAEPGCALYMVNQSLDDPRRLLLYEQYHDRSGYEAHMATDAFKEKILGRVVPMLESRVREFYEVIEPLT